MISCLSVGEIILKKDNDELLYTQIKDWLKEYNKSGKQKYKQAKYKTLIVTGMLPIIKRIAKTIARRSYDPIEDLVQAGSIGLLKAIDSYSINSGIEFRIYAGRTIIGEMRHYLRDKLSSIRVPRHIQELVYRINTFTANLTAEELYDLTSSDVAMALNIPTQAVDYALEAERRTTVFSLEAIYKQSDDSLGYEELIPDKDYKEYIDIEDTKLLLTKLIKNLPDDCRKVVELYYYNDMAQKDIAEELNLTQMSVSRKMKKAFAILYKNLANVGIHDLTFAGN